ncbi:hypothetical protein D9M68_695150 [compost metagenome]
MLGFGAELCEFLTLLPELFTERALFALQALLPRTVQRQFVFGQQRRVAGDFFRHGNGPALGFGGQAFDTGDQRQAVGFGLALVGEKTRVVEAQQYIVLVHHLAFTHEDFADDAAFEVLNDLNLARWNGFALAGGDFFEHGEIGPD